MKEGERDGSVRFLILFIDRRRKEGWKGPFADGRREGGSETHVTRESLIANMEVFFFLITLGKGGCHACLFIFLLV